MSLPTVEEIEARLKRRAYKTIGDQTSYDMLARIEKKPRIEFEELEEAFRLRRGLVREKLTALLAAKLIKEARSKETARYVITGLGKEVLEERMFLDKVTQAPLDTRFK